MLCLTQKQHSYLVNILHPIAFLTLLSISANVSRFC